MKGRQSLGGTRCSNAPSRVFTRGGVVNFVTLLAKCYVRRHALEVSRGGIPADTPASISARGGFVAIVTWAAAWTLAAVAIAFRSVWAGAAEAGRGVRVRRVGAFAGCGKLIALYKLAK